MVEEVLRAYGINGNTSIIPFGHGLINRTWKIEDGKNNFILQKINTQIFKHPEFISENIHAIADFLARYYPGYFFLTPCKTLSGKDLIFIKDEGYYRMFPFIDNSHTINVAENASQTYEAAKKFGELTRLLSAFPVGELKITLPDFHNISLRYRDFLFAMQSGVKERIVRANDLIQFLESQKSIVDEFEKIKSSKAFKLRVTHHDTKINNVLFNEAEKGTCVIDLDTLMPGYFISDVGDMIRTCVPSVSEEEKDIAKIYIRKEIFVAVAEGYLSEMHNELSEEELNCFVYAGKFMIYMQALRFLSDYLNNDVYYGRAYEDHNFYRASNQAHLLKLLIQKDKEFSAIVLDVAEKRLPGSNHQPL
jgi:Ser/Thr protein kinase RdoA (MazF antagonist)